MNSKIKYIFAALFLAHISNNLGLAQDVIIQKFRVSSPHDSTVFRQWQLPDSGENYLILTPDLAQASLDHGRVTIPFIVKNNSDKNIEFTLDNARIEGLATVDEDGKKRFIDHLGGGGSSMGGEYQWVLLKPGETSSLGSSDYPMYTLGAVTGRNIFGVVYGRFVGTKEGFDCYSAPFVVPPELTTLPYNDLGSQNYLSVTPDLTKVDFSGGKFPVTTLELQRANPNYADWIKNGWAEDVSIPLTVSNTLNQDVIVVIDDVDFYIAGDESFKQERMQYRRWEYLKASTPILKPGESISSESTGRSYISLSWLEHRGYKPGDKIIAVVGGRIPGANNIFECYSAPFELPPLPKSEPPAGK
jgi:hypothetical protein